MRRQLLYPIGLLSFVVFVALGVIARSGPLPIDTSVALWFKAHRTPMEVQWAQIFSAITTPLIVFSVVVVLHLFLQYWTRSWYPRDFIPIALVLSSAGLSVLARNFFHRERPGAGLTTLFDFEPGYPSSHSVLIAAVGCSFIFYTGRRQYLILNLAGFAAILMGIDRLILGVHWITDLFGSALLTFGLLVIFYALDEWLAEKERARF